MEYWADLQTIYGEFVREHVIAIDPKTGTYLFAGPATPIKPIQRKFILLDKFFSQKNALGKENDRKDGKEGLFRLLRSLCERMLEYCNALCEQHNHLNLLPQQDQQKEEEPIYQKNGASPSKMLWAALRGRSCQFLGPSVQQDVLRLVIRAFQNFPRLSRKCLVSYIVHMMTPGHPGITKTRVGNAIQILYRAACFNIDKQTEEDSSVLELRPEFTEYDLLRRSHDSQIVKIGLEAGVRMAPEKWSQLLYGDLERKTEMQSHIDRLLMATRNIRGLVEEVYNKLELYKLDQLSPAFMGAQKDYEYIASIAEKYQFDNRFAKDWFDNYDEAEKKNDNWGGENLLKNEISWELLSVCLERVLGFTIAYNDFTTRIQALILGRSRVPSQQIIQRSPWSHQRPHLDRGGLQPRPRYF